MEEQTEEGRDGEGERMGERQERMRKREGERKGGRGKRRRGRRITNQGMEGRGTHSGIRVSAVVYQINGQRFEVGSHVTQLTNQIQTLHPHSMMHAIDFLQISHTASQTSSYVYMYNM